MNSASKKSSPRIKKHFVFERGEQEPLPIILDIPNRTVDLMEILDVFFAIADRIFAKTGQELAQKKRPITCGPGCEKCCNQLVPVSDHEAFHLAQVVGAMPPERRREVESNFEKGIETLKEADLLERMEAHFREHTHDTHEYRDIQTRYWNLGIPCPFLLNGSCSIHPERPITCRQYSVTSDPALCTKVFTGEVRIDEVEHPVDLAGAMAGFDGAGARSTRAVPVILALKHAGECERKELPRLEAERMIGRYIDYASEYYARKK